ncbi:MAG: FAD:protein FMN transferase [Candidatus Krumholzibacteria bacterium]|nr:FAD:protein FMN transferase [Candidatus Krumholzibacteria bacterium]
MKRFLRKAVLSFLVMVAFIAALTISCSRKEMPVTRETFVMGSKCIISIYGMEEDAAAAIAGEAFHELARIDGLMSNWRGDSELSLLNDGPKDTPVEVSKELFEIIERSIHYSGLTGGAFDVTARPLVRLWGFQRKDGELLLEKIPSAEAISRTLLHTGSDKVILNRASLAITLPAGMQIDLAGIGKGYGVDRCVDILRGGGVKSALVNLSGNMYAIGTPPGREGWSIGIREPHGENGIVGKVTIADEAIATSGNYENFVILGGRKYGHIIDPRTGMTVDHLLSVTVVARSAIESDALSTGLFVLGPEASRELSETFPGVRAAFALIDDSFEFMGSSGWKIETK